MKKYSKLLLSAIVLIPLFIENCTTTSDQLPNLVAAGDVTANSAILWARASSVGNLTFEYSTSSTLSSAKKIISKIQTAEKPAKVVVKGLAPKTDYYYRATDYAGKSSSGHFRTLPAPNASAAVHFGASGDSVGSMIPFYSLSGAETADLDFFVNLGDTVYSDIASPDFGAWQAFDVADFRKKYNEVFRPTQGVNYYAGLRASTAIFATIDDHEVTNNFAGGAAPSTDSRFTQSGNFINETPLYQHGLQTFSEFHPIEDLTYSTPADSRMNNKPKMYRYRQIGLASAIFILDMRSFRDAPLPANLDPHDAKGIQKFLSDSATLKRTLLGAQQLADLKADLLKAEKSGVTWKFVFVPDPIENLGIFFIEDRYEGFAYERNILLKYIADNNIKNVVFVTADMHGTVVNNLSYGLPNAVQTPVNSFEIITGPIAFSPPMGYLTVLMGDLYGATNPKLTQGYGSMTPAEKDLVVEDLINGQLKPYGYSLIGLEDSSLKAKLISGNWLATFVYGWTDFSIDETTRKLTISVWGIEWYSPSDQSFDPKGIAGRKPAVYSRFEITPL